MAEQHVLSEAFKFSMREEGGSLYTNDPRDPGGPTKFGVALNYNKDCIPDKNGDGRITAEDVKLLSEEDALDIYENRYWKPSKCHLLPNALAFLFADMVFNPGPGVSPRLLQRALNSLGCNLIVDGKIGPKTLAAIEGISLKDLLEELTCQRQHYYETRPGWKTYGRGWTARTQRCLQAATKLLLGV